MLIISFISEIPIYQRISGLTYATTRKDKDEIRNSWNWIDIVLSIGIVIIVAIIYMYFT